MVNLLPESKQQALQHYIILQALQEWLNHPNQAGFFGKITQKKPQLLGIASL